MADTLPGRTDNAVRSSTGPARLCHDGSMGWLEDRVQRRRAMRGRPNVFVHFSRGQVAAALWDYGEDDLVDRALQMSDRQLAHVQRIAATYEDASYPLPIEGQRITHNHVNALAAVTYFDGRLRPLAQNRRRPAKNRPAHLVDPAPPDPGTGL
jgi:hypothetical protein